MANKIEEIKDIVFGDVLFNGKNWHNKKEFNKYDIKYNNLRIVSYKKTSEGVGTYYIFEVHYEGILILKLECGSPVTKHEYYLQNWKFYNKDIENDVIDIIKKQKVKLDKERKTEKEKSKNDKLQKEQYIQNKIDSYKSISHNKERFNHDATTVEEAIEYIEAKAKQLLYYDIHLDRIITYSWGISALFKNDNEILQSIYILKQYRGNGIYKDCVKHKIITSSECKIAPYLDKNNINYVLYECGISLAYKLIQEHYGNNRAKRSGVPLMNHIDEGLYILNKIGASEAAKHAYCIHPLIQSDEDLKTNLPKLINSGIHKEAISLALEYRSVANDYLSTRKIDSLDDIRLSPLKDVNDMLIADKIQNRKDFELYHKLTHPRSKELTVYFHNWLDKLLISEYDYYGYKQILTKQHGIL